MVGINQPIPPKDDSDTYSLKQLQSELYWNTTVSVMTLSPGQQFTITTKLSLNEKLTRENTFTTSIGSAQLVRSSKWFSLVDAAVNGNGEIVYTLAVTSGGKKTESDRILKVTEQYQEGGAGLHTLFRHSWYQVA
ncbi:hypothetical protein ABVK25_000093 [Lepraria finkii]|uniref:Uncharacterized protein n=1 Tax=Lepraria finkii TaxID=1340010 RepID=A0ABR4BN54_9LECA